MARAYSVWLVVQRAGWGVDPIAAFTVKHELVSWIREQERPLVDCWAIRMPDGTDDAGKNFELDELLA